MKWSPFKKKQESQPEPETCNVFTGIDVWKRSDNRLYDFNDIKQWLQPYTVEEVRAAVNNPTVNHLGKHIQLVWDIEYLKPGQEVYHWCYAIFPNKIAVGFNFESYERHNHSDPDLLEYLTVPVYAEENGEADSLGFDCIEKIEWEESTKPVETLSFGGATDFYEKYNWWPHIQMENYITKEKRWEPYCYIGEIYFNNQKIYMFEGTKVTDEKYNPYHFEGNIEVRFTAIQENNPVLSPWVKAQQLPENISGVYCDIEDTPNIDKRIVPTTRFPKIVTGCQGDYILESPFNNFIYQIPVIWYGYKKIENGHYRIEDGWDTYTVSHNNQGEYRASFQCT